MEGGNEDGATPMLRGSADRIKLEIFIDVADIMPAQIVSPVVWRERVPTPEPANHRGEGRALKHGSVAKVGGWLSRKPSGNAVVPALHGLCSA